VTQLSAFVGVTGLVLTGFLVLARLSQRVVDPDEADDPPTRGDERPTPGWDGQPPTDVNDGVHGRVGDSRRRAGETPERRPTTADRAAATADGHGVDTPASVVADRPGEAGLRPVDPPGVEDPMASLSSGAVLANVALTQGLFGGLLAAAAWYFGVPATALGLWGEPVDGGLAVGVGVAFGCVLWLGNEVASGLADAAGAAYDEGLRTMLAPGDVRGWLVLLCGTLPVIAVVEEFLFRAAAIGATGATLPVSPWALAVVSSVAFALGHGAQGRVGVVVTGALGFVLAAGFVLTGSFLVVVVAHYLVNALEFLVHEGVGLPDPVWA
jgi:membrane protease YdiL (CAAX protease family)